MLICDNSNTACFPQKPLTPSFTHLFTKHIIFSIEHLEDLACDFFYQVSSCTIRRCISKAENLQVSHFYSWSCGVGLHAGPVHSKN